MGLRHILVVEGNWLSETLGERSVKPYCASLTPQARDWACSRIGKLPTSDVILMKFQVSEHLFCNAKPSASKLLLVPIILNEGHVTCACSKP